MYGIFVGAGNIFIEGYYKREGNYLYAPVVNIRHHGSDTSLT